MVTWYWFADAFFDRCQLTITWISNIKDLYCKPMLHVFVNPVAGEWLPCCVAVVIVVRTRPWAIPLAMIIMRKSIHGFLFLSYVTHRDRGGSGTKILGHTDGSLRSPPRVRIFFPEPPLSLCVRRFVPNVCRFRLVCKYFCHNVCSLKFIFCWRNAEVNIERNGGCKFFEGCS